MTSLIAIFITSLAVGFSGAVMPGPLSALTLKESLRRGKTVALWLSAGHSLCELLMVGALAMGLSRFLKGDSFIGTVGLIGGAILTWMGASAFRQARENPSRLDDSVPIGRVQSLLINGAAVTLVNPYWFVWWFSAGLLQVLNGAKAGIAGIAAFYFGHISADFLWLGAVGFLVSWRRDLFRGKIYHRTIQTFASVLILFGLLFIGYGGILIHSAVTR